MMDVNLQSAGTKQIDLFRLLVNSVKDYAIFLLDPRGYILSWNEGAQRIKGYTREEILGKHFSIFYPARDVRHGKPEYGLKVAMDEGRWEEEGWRVRKDGSRFWASVVLTALYGDDGALVGFAKVTRDLSERKRVEEERAQLLELEHAARTRVESMVERLRIIQAVTEEALAHLNLDELLAALLDRISEALEVDTVAVLLLERPGADVLVARAAKGIEEEVEQGVRVPVGEGFAGRIVAERQPVIVDDVEHGDVFNPILWQKGIKSLLGVPLIIEGRPLGVIHVGSLHRRQFTEHDVHLLQIVADRVALAIDHAYLFEAAQTARHEAEVAEARVQAQDEFLSIAAHELKTPLTGLRLSAQMLVRRLQRGATLDAATLERPLQTVERQTERLSRLVTQLLETVRAQAGRLELDQREVDVVELVQGVMAHLQPLSPSRLVLHAPEPVWATVDPLRFEQVVMNLLDNAVKFSPQGKPIDIDVERQESGAMRLSVRDRGIGVPAEHRARLFERFYQAHGNEFRSGMGLGLYITREIIERHGGTIEAEHPSDGGTRFVVELPAGTSQGRV